MARTAPRPAPAAPTERRRPGRLQSPDAELIPLMRRPGADADKADDYATKWTPRDPVAPPRGIALGVALSAPIWAAMGGLFYLLLR